MLSLWSMNKLTMKPNAWQLSMSLYLLSLAYEAINRIKRITTRTSYQKLTGYKNRTRRPHQGRHSSRSQTAARRRRTPGNPRATWDWYFSGRSSITRPLLCAPFSPVASPHYHASTCKALRTSKWESKTRPWEQRRTMPRGRRLCSTSNSGWSSQKSFRLCRYHPNPLSNIRVWNTSRNSRITNKIEIRQLKTEKRRWDDQVRTSTRGFASDN